MLGDKATVVQHVRQLKTLGVMVRADGKDFDAVEHRLSAGLRAFHADADFLMNRSIDQSTRLSHYMKCIIPDISFCAGSWAWFAGTARRLITRSARIRATTLLHPRSRVPYGTVTKPDRARAGVVLYYHSYSIVRYHVRACAVRARRGNRLVR